MTQIVFGNYQFRFREENGVKQIFDQLRKKFVPFTPEEWVRQHISAYLLEKNFSAALIAVERQIEVNGLQKRFDLVVFGRDSQPLMVVECKAPSEKINEKALMQILAYNLHLKAKYFWLTNGETNYCYDLKSGQLLENIPPVATSF